MQINSRVLNIEVLRIILMMKFEYVMINHVYLEMIWGMILRHGNMKALIYDCKMMFIKEGWQLAPGCKFLYVKKYDCVKLMIEVKYGDN